MEFPNPFLALEPDANCPPELKHELVAEIELIRNMMTVVELYVGDFFNSAIALADRPVSQSDSSTV